MTWRHFAMSCAKIAEPIKMSFGFWTWVGPRKHVLGRVYTGSTMRIPLDRPGVHVRQRLSNYFDHMLLLGRIAVVRMFTVFQKNLPPLTCYNLYIHGSIATIFGKNVAKKVGSQNILYFSTSPNYCFCTTWGNRIPENCIFSLKCCMLFTKKTWNS